MKQRWIGLVLAAILMVFGISPSPISLSAYENNLLRIPITHPAIIGTLLDHSFSFVEVYESFVLTRATAEQIAFLEAQQIAYQPEKDTGIIQVGRYEFLANSDKAISSIGFSIEGVQSSLHLLQWIGPEKSSWKETLSDWEVRFLIPVYKNAWIVEMNPAFVSAIKEFRFVQALQVLPNCTRQNLDVSLLNTNGVDLEIRFASLQKAKSWILQHGYPNIPVSEAGLTGMVLIPAFPVQAIADLVLEPDIVSFMNRKEPMLLNAEAAQVLNIRDNMDLNRVNGLEGQGEIVAYGDTGLSTGNPATIHDAFKMPTFADKVVAVFPALAWGDVAGHGTHVAGSIVGTGAGDTIISNGTRYKGMAPKAQLVAQNVWTYGSSMYQILEDAYNSGAKIHSNSWHNAETVGQYDYYAYEIDQFQWDHMDFQALFAAGNYRADYRSWFPVNGGPYSLTSFSASKNSISVGATENFKPGYNQNEIAYFSSEGPTTDGRMKPDIVSPGAYVRSTLRGGGYGNMQGTSMATPVTAGAITLVREFVRKNTGIKPREISAALMKAILLHGANTDIMTDSPSFGGEPLLLSEHNFVSGWGRTDIQNSLFPTGRNVKLFNEYNPDGTKGLSNEMREKKYYVEVLDPAQPLKATLVWTDFPGTPCGWSRPYDYYDQVPELVNNLDLSIRKYGDNEHLYFGNRFNSNGFSQINPSNRDHLNNVEIILIPSPETGIYEITVSALNSQIQSDLQHGYKQPYAMVVTGGNLHTVFPPAEPFQLTSQTECSAITLHWNTPPLVQFPVKEYLLHRIALTGPNAGEHVTFTITALQTTYMDTQILLGTEYWYYLQAINTKGLLSVESNGTLAGNLTPPKPPHPYEPSQVTSDQVFWYWNQPKPGTCPIDYYRVFRSTNPLMQGEEIAILDPEVHSLIDKNVVPGETYYYTFYSVDIVPLTSAPHQTIAVTIPKPETVLALSVESSVREICAGRNFFLTVSLYNQSMDNAKDLHIVITPDSTFTILQLVGISGVRQANGSWKITVPNLPPNNRIEFQANVQSNQTTTQEKSYTIVTSLLQNNFTVTEAFTSLLVKPCSSSQPGNFYGRINLAGLKMDPETGKKYLPVGDTLTMRIQVLNGHPNYQVQIRWGDGEKTDEKNLDMTEFAYTHAYTSQGSMEIEIVITDSVGRQFTASIPIQVR